MTAAEREIDRQRRLLTVEYEAEREEYTRIIDRLGIERLAARGHARFPVTLGRDYYNSLNSRVIELTGGVDADDADDYSHDFEPGRQVVIVALQGDPGATPRRLMSATVSFVDGARMVVALPDGAEVAKLRGDEGRLGVILSFDETTYRTMFEALDRLVEAKGRLGYLRDLFYGRSGAAEELTLPPMRFPYLNPSQEDAVNKVLRAKDVAVVHGPPGTGKTTTLVEAIAETLRRESQVMVCAQSNMAVDLISEKLVDRGVNVVRLGNPSRVDDKMLSFTYERRFEAHPDYPTLWSIRKALRELRGARRSSDQWHQKVDRLRSRAIELEIRINNDIFASANVIASTLTGSASRLLEGMTFPTVFIDEAAQALEAACWIPMRRARRMVLAGDHCQLPPTVKSLEALKGGLGRSLMERIVENHPEAVKMLTVQYRMHEDIMRFSAEWFYGGVVEAAPEVRHRGILDFEIPITWIDTTASHPVGEDDAAPDDDFRETLAQGSFGRVNKAEAELTVRLLEEYITHIGRQRVIDERIDFGIITPYRAQVNYLRRLLRAAAWARPLRRLISVNTVDGFQGRERDVIILSLVRSNDSRQIGFLRDLRRMNVAITRTRSKLIIVGSVDTLAGAHPFYRRLHRYIESLS